jgi:membrane peptidoglycan carboxypeptidase
VLIGCFAFVLPALVPAGVGATWVLRVYDSAPALDALRPLSQSDVSTVYAADGSRLGAIHFDTVRDPVPSKRIAPALKQATVASRAARRSPSSWSATATSSTRATRSGARSSSAFGR